MGRLRQPGAQRGDLHRPIRGLTQGELNLLIGVAGAKQHACDMFYVSGVPLTELTRTARRWGGPEETRLMSCCVPACCLPTLSQLDVCPTPSIVLEKGSVKQLIQLLYVKVREAFGGIVEVNVQLSHDGRLSSFMPDGQQAPETIK